MRVVELKYGKKISDENYGSEEISVTVLGDGTNLEDLFQQAKNFVEINLSETAELAKQNKALKEGSSPVPVQKAEKKSLMKAEKPATVKEEIKEEEVKEEKKKPAKKEDKSSRADEVLPFDRNNPDHKEELSKILDKNFPGWLENDDLTKKAGQASRLLTSSKEPFISVKGKIVDAFESTLIELMK